MYLQPSNLVPYLLGRGLVLARSVVDAGISIRELPRRHRNFVVALEDGPGLFVKQARDLAPTLATDLGREAALYRAIHSADDGRGLKTLVPCLIDFDAIRHVLVLELIQPCETLTEFHRRRKDWPIDVAQRLGAIVRSMHVDLLQASAAPPVASCWTNTVPRILSAGGVDDPLWLQFGAGGAALLDLLRHMGDVWSALAELRASWKPDALIHGDLKWDNCLVQSEQPFALRLIDWELAGRGEAMWDVAGAMHDYVMHAAERRELAAAGAALRAVWGGYCRAGPSLSGHDERLRARCLQLLAARLLQSVFEHVRSAARAAGDLAPLLDVSRSLLVEPRRASASRLGW